tara:strand:- start:286 stop:576 length:291 start_codon:yes stop_codon:yes gene_type:complete
MNNEEIVYGFLSEYFGDRLNENVTDDDIVDVVCELNELCDAVNEYFDLYEEDDEGMMDFDAPATLHFFNTALSDKEKRKYRVSRKGRGGGHLSKEG